MLVDRECITKKLTKQIEALGFSVTTGRETLDFTLANLKLSFKGVPLAFLVTGTKRKPRFELCPMESYWYLLNLDPRVHVRFTAPSAELFLVVLRKVRVFERIEN